MNEIIKKIEDYALEDIMGDRFGKYAKEIIQERAIPDVRDGLKPVQRRILFAMHDAGTTHLKPYVKCAYTVGNVLGKFHPHGDSSVYDAMVRMSQYWKQNHILIDIHGNNGSMDGDPAAAYRYTEARLSKMSGELLKDLNKNTVTWAPNFDDRFLEPTVLPVKYPNLLVNGASGISAGYATNIPPHNLGEIIDATIKRIDNPNSRLESFLSVVKGPDFPTGGTIYGTTGINDAFRTGRGRVVIRSKYEIVKVKGKEQIVITEIPFEVNKANLVAKMDFIRIDKRIEGIAEVRDESDRTGLRIAIDLKSGANSEFIVNYLLKNTEMQVSYSYNMVAIVNKVPKVLSLLDILDAYIAHQEDFITSRTKFDLAFFKKQFHISEGLIKAISVLDEVIKVIRESKNKIDAKENLVKEFDFTIEQAEAIVMLQLYKLTNTDIVVLEEEIEKLRLAIKGLEEILNNPEKLRSVMKLELKNIKKEYAHPRLSQVAGEIEDIKLDTKVLIALENVVVVVTNEGYVKKVSFKSYKSTDEETLIKPGDYIIGKFEVTTLETVVLFTNLGNYCFVPVHILPDVKCKELGKHISNVIDMSSNEKIVAAKLYNKDLELCLFSKNGMSKRIKFSDLEVTRFKKAMTTFKLKELDEVISVVNKEDEVVLMTNNGYYLRYNTEEIPLVGIKASGVKAINLKDDYVVNACSISSSSEYLNIFTNYHTYKRIKLSDLNKLTRAKKGSMLFKSVKTKNYNVAFAHVTNSRDINIFVSEDILEVKNSDIPIMDLSSTGSNITNRNYNYVALKAESVKKEVNKVDKVEPEDTTNINHKTSESKQMSFDEFTKDFRLN